MATVVWAAQGQTLNVKVTYSGGEVNADHAIYLAIWDSPNLTGGAIPIGQQKMEESGGMASFPNLSAAKVYVTAVYDEAGGIDPNTGAGFPGQPVGVYNADAMGQPGAIDLGGGETDIELTFDGTIRIP